MYLKSVIRNLLRLVYKLPFLEKPLPKYPFGKRPWASKEKYLRLYKKATQIDDKKLILFEKEYGYSIDNHWINELALSTQIVIKNEELNYFHGRVLYSVLSKYINNQINKKEENINILETGTARGFSAICMSKAINDNKAFGKIISLDCIAHNQKIFWNCITDTEGPKTRSQLLDKWPREISNILFLQGWTKSVLYKLGCARINFAFLDAQHTKENVLHEFEYIYKRQLSGDIVVFDDVTPGIFDGVCEAIDCIEENYPYSVKKISFSSQRGYAIAIKN